MRFTAKQTAAYGLGAVGKDMVYALSASYVMYYYQDILGLPASFVGLILMAARVFDAVNDPFMGDPFAQPVPQNPYGQDPFAADPFAADPFAQPPMGGNPYGDPNPNDQGYNNGMM